MIKKLLVILLIFSGFVASAQIKSSEIKDYSLVYAFNNTDTLIRRQNNHISVTLFKISNPSGSAHVPETEDITNRYLIAVSEFDETPEQHLFNVGDFYAPKIVKFASQKNNDFYVIIEYGFYKNRKKIGLNISLKKVTVASI